MKGLEFWFNENEVCSLEPNWQWAIWTNDDGVFWHLHLLPALDGAFNDMQLITRIRLDDFFAGVGQTYCR